MSHNFSRSRAGDYVFSNNKFTKIFSNFSVMKIIQKIKLDVNQRRFYCRTKMYAKQSNTVYKAINIDMPLHKTREKAQDDLDFIRQQIKTGWSLGDILKPFPPLGQISLSSRGDYVFADENLILVFSAFCEMMIDHNLIFNKDEETWTSETLFVQDNFKCLQFSSPPTPTKQEAKLYRNNLQQIILKTWKLDQ